VIYRGRTAGMGRMGEMSTTITVDPIVVNGQVVDQAQPIIGNAPPVTDSGWWPLLAVAAALGLVWWLSSEDDQEEGDDDDRPFDE
jgi:hypothetical protein